MTKTPKCKYPVGTYLKRTSYPEKTVKIVNAQLMWVYDFVEVGKLDTLINVLERHLDKYEITSPIPYAVKSCHFIDAGILGEVNVTITECTESHVYFVETGRFEWNNFEPDDVYCVTIKDFEKAVVKL